MAYVNPGNGPNYFPNSVDGLTFEDPSAVQSVFPVSGDAIRYDTGQHSEYDNFTQVNTFWTDVIGPAERERLVNNIAGSLRGAIPEIQERTVANFTQVNTEFGEMLAEALAAASKGRGRGRRSSSRVLASKKRKQ